MKGVVIMRVISGKYKGRKIEGYNIEGTRPTQDRVKESLFAMIQEELYDSTILDLFTGSGNLGIEALSNGSKKAYFVDNNTECIKILKKNLENISEHDYQVLNTDYLQALAYFSKEMVSFDIIFLDPPYKLECISDILEIIIKNNLLNTDGIIVCEYEFNNFKDNYNSLELIKEKKYGYKNIRIYRRTI